MRTTRSGAITAIGDGGPLRSGTSNAPLFTADKRAKFTQRESKKWVRLLTVLLYVLFVCMPAVLMAVYYLKIWDPGYLRKFPPELNLNRSGPSIVVGSSSSSSLATAIDASVNRRVEREVSNDPAAQLILRSFVEDEPPPSTERNANKIAQCDCSKVVDIGQIGKAMDPSPVESATVDLADVLRKSAHLQQPPPLQPPD